MRRWATLTAVVLTTVAGCSRSDGDRLARVGRQTTKNLQALVPERTPLEGSLALPKSQRVEDRVRERFQSDRHLAALGLEISGSANTIRLKGQVGNSALKSRAIDIAEATVGVDKVIDDISVAAK